MQIKIFFLRELLSLKNTEKYSLLVYTEKFEKKFEKAKEIYLLGNVLIFFFIFIKRKVMY